MGYDYVFLGADLSVATPTVDTSLVNDLVLVKGAPVIDYTHFSLTMSRSRRLARWVGWNIDGARFEFADRISRDGVDFRPDPRVDLTSQTLDDVYASNSLDRGHLARRSDLLWGPLVEAQQANEDSFFFTNISPQQANFNQSGAAGIWGELEDALLDSAKADEQRVSVFAGPVLAENDVAYRGTLIPRSYWKLIAYTNLDRLEARAFLLTQDLDGLEQVALDDFAVYAVPVRELEQRTNLAFDPGLVDADQAQTTAPTPRRVRSLSNVTW